ncbi:MAG: hypothetical protein OXM61_17425 [Candidatus Poribacteria bacterium]|nr:hypothetical protein [Candidatus Poribacteria bacterium]
MKRFFTTLCLLTLCVLPINDIGRTQQSISVIPDTPIRFRVCVYVSPHDDTDLDTRLEAFLRRELRALGDVTIVQRESDWHFFLAYNFAEHEFKDGTKTGDLSIAEALMSFHPDVIHETYRFPEIGKPALFEHIIAGYWTADNLHEFAIQAIGIFDKDTLEPFRKK